MSGTVSGTSLNAGEVPTFGLGTRTADGFQIVVTNYDPAVTYTVSTDAGAAALSDGTVTVTGLEPGSSAEITVTAARAGYTTVASSATGTALEAGVPPTLSDPVRTADGFTVGIIDPDSSADYEVTTTAGTVTSIEGTLTVTGLAPGETATLTVTVLRGGSTPASTELTVAALEAGVGPVLGEPQRTANGFTVAVIEPDSATTYTATSTAGTVTVQVAAGTVTVVVTGLDPGQSATVTVGAARPGFTDASADATGTALAVGAAATTGPVVRTVDGFTFPITNHDPAAGYVLTTTAGVVEVDADGTVTVTGLEPTQTASVTITVSRAGATTQSTTVTGAALGTGTPPTVLPPPTSTVDGFVFALTDPVDGTEYTVATTAGQVMIVDGIVTVSGLAPGESAVVTVTATRDGETTATVDITGAALRTGPAVVLSAPGQVAGGFQVRILDPDPDATYVAASTAGTVTVVDGVVTVTGLGEGQTAVLTVVATRAGFTPASATATGTAPVPAVLALTGGDVATTTTSTPVISGISDAPAGSTVTVTVNGQTLTTTVGADGTWSVTPAALPDGDYEVVVSITVLGVTSTVTQMLTVAAGTGTGGDGDPDTATGGDGDPDTGPGENTDTDPGENHGTPAGMPPAHLGSGGLAYTGVDTRLPGAIGTSLLVLGALLLGLARRRRTPVTTSTASGESTPIG